MSATVLSLPLSPRFRTFGSRSGLEPLRRATTLLHEIGHVIAGLVSGGDIMRLHAGATDGFVEIANGWPPLIFAAGYAAPLAAFSGLAALLHQHIRARWLGYACWTTAIIDLFTDWLWPISQMNDIAQFSTSAGCPSLLFVIGQVLASVFIWYATLTFSRRLT